MSSCRISLILFGVRPRRADRFFVRIEAFPLLHYSPAKIGGSR